MQFLDHIPPFSFPLWCWESWVCAGSRDPGSEQGAPVAIPVWNLGWKHGTKSDLYYEPQLLRIKRAPRGKLGVTEWKKSTLEASELQVENRGFNIHLRTLGYEEWGGGW